MTSPNARLTRIIFICFFISGMAGLIYEILWIRMLGLVFGHTVYAITTVLVAFMGGLAIGSYLCGRVIDRVKNLLRLYSILEIAIGGYCLLIPWLVEGMKVVYISIARSIELPFTVFTLIQFTLATLILLVPTTLMGATLPILSRYFIRDLGSVGKQVGRLYALNTFGAVLGTYLAGFELLPVLGITLTTIFSAVLNIGIGALIFVSIRETTPQGENRPISIEPISQNISWDLDRWVAVGAFAVSGSVSMIYEIAWTRALSLTLGSSTYAFSAMLLGFLLGIAAGSAIFTGFSKNRMVSYIWFGLLQLGIGLSAALCLPLFERFPDLFMTGFRYSHSYGFILMLQVLIALLAMILPTLFIGATFPCIAQLISRNLSGIGGDIGRVYAWNTAGAIVGSLIAGFVFIPFLGVQTSIKVAIAMNLFVALFFLLYYSRSVVFRFVSGSAISLAVLSVIFLPPWNPNVMIGGVAVYAQRYLEGSKKYPLHEMLSKMKILYYKDGISSTVSVHQFENDIFLRVNGKTDASTGVDMHTQLMLGHIPALLHSNTRTALVIGLGSGITAGALTQYDLKRIDVVEIEPAVIQAASFFGKENRDVLQNPKVKVVTADARNFLLASPKRYDLILSEPSNPWIGGVASLFTVEFFNLAREHLNPGGIMVQWFHGYGMMPEDFQMVVASFRWIFPNANLWTTNTSDYLLVGSMGPVVVDLERIRKLYNGNPMLREDMRQVNMASPEAILSDFFLDEDDLGRLVAGADLNTDDKLPLEFSTPRALYENTVQLNAQMLRRAKKSHYPMMTEFSRGLIDRLSVQYDLASSYIHKGMPNEAMEHLKAVLKIDPQYVPALVDSGRIKMHSPQILEAMDDFQAALKADPRSSEAHYQLGLLYFRQNKTEEGIKSILNAISLDPDNQAYHLELATDFRKVKRYDEAIDEYRQALKHDPQDQRILGALGATLIVQEKPADAVVVLDQAIAIDPNDHRLRFQIGQAYLLLKQAQQAQKAFEAAIALDPGDADPYVGLGKAWIAIGDRRKAIGYFKKATEINPRINIPEV